MSALLWTLGILSLVVFIVVKYFTNCGQYWSKRGFTVVGSETSGNMFINIITRVHQAEVDVKIYKEARRLNQPIVGFIEITNPVVYVTDLDLIKNIFIKDFDSFMDRRPFMLEKTDPIFHKMLFFRQSEAWKELRTKMSPTFTTGKIRRMFEIFHSSSSKLVNYVQTQGKEHDGIVDFTDGYQRYTMDVIASAAFGVDSKTFSEEDSVFQRMGKKFQFELTPKLMLTFILMLTAPKVAAGLTFHINIIFSYLQFYPIMTRSIMN